VIVNIVVGGYVGVEIVCYNNVNVMAGDQGVCSDVISSGPVLPGMI